MCTSYPSSTVSETSSTMDHICQRRVFRQNIMILLSLSVELPKYGVGQGTYEGPL